MSNTWDYVDPGYVADGYVWTGRPVIFEYGATRAELHGPSRRSGSLRLLQADKYSTGWERHGYPPIAIVSSLSLEYNQMRGDEYEQLAAFQSTVDYSTAEFSYIEGNTGYTVPVWFANSNQTIEEASFNRYTGKIELQSLTSFIPLPAVVPSSINDILANPAYSYPVDIRRAQPSVWVSSGIRRVVNKSVITRRTHTLSLVRKTATELGNLLSFFQNTAVGIKNTWSWLDARPVMREGTINLLSSNQASVETDTTGFSVSPGWFINSGAAMVRDTTLAYVGSSSLKVTTDGSTVREGMYTVGISAAANTAHTASCWVYAPVGASMYMYFRDATNNVTTGTAFTGTGAWQQVVLTITTGSTAVTNLALSVQNWRATTITFWVDALQIEAKPYATLFVAGTRPDYPESVTRTVRFAETSISWTQSSVRSDRYDLDIILEEDLR